MTSPIKVQQFTRYVKQFSCTCFNVNYKPIELLLWVEPVWLRRRKGAPFGEYNEISSHSFGKSGTRRGLQIHVLGLAEETFKKAGHLFYIVAWGWSPILSKATFSNKLHALLVSRMKVCALSWEQWNFCSCCKLFCWKYWLEKESSQIDVISLVRESFKKKNPFF